MGGTSSEKNVSIKTGNAVIKALSSIYKKVTPIVVGGNQDLAFLDDIGPGDIIFNALHGGFGENGDLQSTLELRNISYTGSDSKASKICINKHLSKLVAQAEGICTPSWVLYKNKKNNHQKLFNSNSKFSYPYIIKPNDEGSTMGLAKVEK